MTVRHLLANCILITNYSNSMAIAIATALLLPTVPEQILTFIKLPRVLRGHFTF